MENKISNLSSRPNRQFLDPNFYNKDIIQSDNSLGTDKFSPFIFERNIPNYLDKYRGQFTEDNHKHESSTMKKRKRSSKLDRNDLIAKKKYSYVKKNPLSNSRKKLSLRSNKKNKISLESMKTRLSNITETPDTFTDNEKISKKNFKNFNDFMQNLTKKFQVKDENGFNKDNDKFEGKPQNFVSDTTDFNVKTNRTAAFESANCTDRELYIQKIINEEKASIDERLNKGLNYRKPDVWIEEKNIEDSSHFSFKKYAYDLPQAGVEISSDFKETEKNLDNLDSPQETPNLGIQYSENNNINITDSKFKVDEDIEMDNNVKVFNVNSNSVHTGSLFKKLKFKLNNKESKKKFTEKISIVTEKIYEKIIPHISLNTPFQAYEIKLDYNDNNDILSSEIKPRAFNFTNLNDNMTDAPQAGADDQNLETIKEEIEETEQIEQIEELNDDCISDKNEIMEKDLDNTKEEIFLSLPQHFRYENFDIFMYIKSTMVIFIFVFVFYNFIKKGQLSLDHKKSMIYLLVPTISFAMILGMYFLYSKSDEFKVKRIIEYIKHLMLEEEKKVGKDNLIQLISEQFSLNSSEVVESRIFSQIVDDFSLDNLIEEFIDNENNNSLSWRRKKTIFCKK
jgi:hypothetical protein